MTDLRASLNYPGPLFSPDDCSELGETVMQSCALRSILFPLSGPYAYKIKSIPPSCHIPSPSIRLILLIPQPSRQSPDGFYHAKMRKCLNYRHFRIGDQMVDGFFEKSGLIGYYDRLELNRSDYRSDFRSDDGYSGRIIFHIL